MGLIGKDQFATENEQVIVPETDCPLISLKLEELHRVVSHLLQLSRYLISWANFCTDYMPYREIKLSN